MTRASAAQNVQFGRGHPAELPHPITAPNGGSRVRGLIAARCPARIDPSRAGHQDRRKGNQGSHCHE